MDAFPAFFPLAGRLVVIAGSGEAAAAKARLFDGSPARVVRIGGPDALTPAPYRDALLAFIADPDEAFAAGAARAAREAGALVNVTDRPALCDFTTPAVIDRGEVVAAVGTGGASPLLAALLRSDIEQRLPEGTGRIAALLHRLQDEIRGRLPDLAARRAFLRDAVNGPAAEAALAGEMDRAATLLRQALDQAGAVAGRLDALDARGPADLVSLRAARALAAADVLVIEAGVDPAIVALARRDSERIQGSGPDARVQMAAGRRVVWLHAGSQDLGDAAVLPVAEQ